MTEPRRILLLAPFPPRRDAAHGGGRSFANLVVHLAKRVRVSLAYLRASDELGIDPAVADVCEIVHEGRRAGVAGSSVRPWPRAFAVLPGMAAGRPLWVAARWDRSFAAEVQRITAEWRPHIVQAEYSAMGQYLDGIRELGTRLVMTIYDPSGAGARERGAGASPLLRPGWAFSARRWDRYEQKLLRQVDATVVFTDRDGELMRALHPGARLERIPLGIHIPQQPSDPVGCAPPMLLFVGNFVHAPNLDAARWLVDEIFPALRARYPELGLWVVGDNAPAWLARHADQGVTVTGRVPDVQPYMDRAALFVAPLRSGGGMRVKVLEAMAAGKAVVATPLAAQGLEIEDGVHALTPSTTEDFVKRIAELLDDSGRRRRLATQARAWAEDHLSWDRCACAYETLYDEICQASPPALTSAQEVV